LIALIILGKFRNFSLCTYSKVRIDKHWPDSFPIIKKNTEALIDASKEVGLEINVKETKYMLLFRHQNAGQICHIKMANK
jgi:hypothetical protein